MEAACGAALGALGFGARELDTVRALLSRFGAGARAIAAGRGLDGLAADIDREIDYVLGLLGRLEVSGTATGALPHDPTRSLARIAGAALLIARYRDRLSPRDALQALALQVAYVYLQDTLDHILDHGTYRHEEARCLYRAAWRPMTDREADTVGLEDELRRLLNSDHAAAAAPLVGLVRFLRAGIDAARHGETMRPYLRWVNERFAWAETASVFQQRSRLDVASIRRIAEGFWAPEPDLAWHERFAAHLSWVTNCSLFPLCFARELPSTDELRNHMRAWYYFDAVISYMDHLADLREDYEEGIVNDVLLSLGESRPGWRWDAFRLETVTDREDVLSFLRRVAVFERRALRYASQSGADRDGFYPVLGLMIPVVMLARADSAGAWMLPAYLEELGPALRDPSRAAYQSATYSQQGSPRRTHRGFATLPLNPRDFRIPS